jgi:hypothetical protein
MTRRAPVFVQAVLLLGAISLSTWLAQQGPRWPAGAARASSLESRRAPSLGHRAFVFPAHSPTREPKPVTPRRPPTGFRVVARPIPIPLWPSKVKILWAPPLAWGKPIVLLVRPKP